MEKKLVIFDSDAAYCERLMEYINAKKSYGIRAVAFTEEDTMLAYLSLQEVDYILCEEQSAGITELAGKSGKRFLLSSVKPPDRREMAVSRYQSAEQILRKLTAAEAPGGSAAPGPGEEFILGIGSITEDGSTAAYAWKLAVQYAAEQRVLYLGFHPLFRPVSTETPCVFMSELIYRLRQERTVSHSEELIQTIEGVDAILGYSFWADADELGTADAEALLGWLREQNGYDRIILELEGLRSATCPLLEGCDRILFLRTGSELETRRYHEFERQLKFAGKSLLAERLRAGHAGE